MTDYRFKFSRRNGESKSQWLDRLDYARRDIYSTMPLHAFDSPYTARVYSELDELRAAQLRADRGAPR
jgi:hypothetical protein